MDVIREHREHIFESSKYTWLRESWSHVFSRTLRYESS